MPEQMMSFVHGEQFVTLSARGEPRMWSVQEDGTVKMLREYHVGVPRVAVSHVAALGRWACGESRFGDRIVRDGEAPTCPACIRRSTP